MTSRLKWILMVGAAVALIAVGGGVASGVSGGGSGEVDDGRDDTPVTGSQSDDIRAAATTRFPPALVSAIEKAEPRGGRFGPFWFVGTGPADRSVDERIATLQDL